jgi:hypothetical protein
MWKTRKIQRNGYELQVPEDNFCSLRFKGPSGKTYRPTTDKMGQEFQAELFPVIERGLRGEGLSADLSGRSIRDMLAATTKEFGETKKDLPGLLARTIPKADVGVRDYISRSVDAAFARTKEGIRDEFATTEFDDKNIAQNLAFNALATEMGLGSRITDLTNQSMLRRSQSPTFASELAGGLGGMAGILGAGYKPTRVPAGLMPANQYWGGSQSGSSSSWGPFQQPSPSSSATTDYLGQSTFQWLRPPAVNYANGFVSAPTP